MSDACLGREADLGASRDGQGLGLGADRGRGGADVAADIVGGDGGHGAVGVVAGPLADVDPFGGGAGVGG